MLPSIVARELQDGLKHFLSTAFPSTTPAFQGVMEDFLNREQALCKGPWLEVKLPFRPAPPDYQAPFQQFRLPYLPYRHQQVAFDRLCRAQPLSSIVATGTGSGKTECFMYPILDYCLGERRQGIKAIIIYPMNALASDQARRFAKEVSRLDTRLTVGLFTGDEGGQSKSMGADQVISHRDTLRDNPPDILLTNYKMLDFLLMRPKDQRLWRHNTPGLLRYLVVDELHTFDGAQGTDLACLVRRLRAKLNSGEELACVGTSATIGDDSGIQSLCKYAQDVFSTDFDSEAIILEDRLSVAEYLQTTKRTEVLSVWPRDQLRKLVPGQLSQGEYLRRLAWLWLGKELALDASDPIERDKARVVLGEWLCCHTAFESLLRVAHKVCDLNVLAEDWGRRFNLTLNHLQTLLLIESLCALISAARVWRIPDQPDKGTQPFLQVRIQLWLRELRRMVASVEPQPVLRHYDDLDNPHAPLHLPLVHCRDCHSMAWGAVKPEGDNRLKALLQGFYSSWFGRSPDACLLYPLSEEAPRPSEGEQYLCSSCLTLHRRGPECPDCSREMLRVWVPNLLRSRSLQDGGTRLEASSDCPCCQGKSALSILGSRAASMASVAIADLYGSAFNDDYRLIAFSDSVQDAAHRAGFFGARTYPQIVRQAIARVVREHGEGMSLSRLVTEVPAYWRQQLGSDENFVGTFIAPNMAWMSDYQQMLSEGQLPVGSPLADRVALRLGWDTLMEFSLRSRIGRTLERSAVAIPQVDFSTLQQDVVAPLTRQLKEELGTLREIESPQVLIFVLGLLRRMRQVGAVQDSHLEGYIKERGKTFLLSRQSHLPGYGPLSPPPAPLSMKRVSPYFEEVLSSRSGWYLGWFNKCLAVDQPLATAEYAQAYQLTLRQLTQAGWLCQQEVGGDPVWVLQPRLWSLTTRVAEIACQQCGHRQMVAAEEFSLWLNQPCLHHGCSGRYQAQGLPDGDLAYRAFPRRLMPSEHTGLLDGKQRLEIENSFMRPASERHPWDINLLSATPTLEMGINIGDLSTVLLCSIPPAQTNYLQRIGRAGRTDGNALALAIANGSNHDNYFYAQPLEMLAGSIVTPGVFLKAMAVLERQLIAWCFDRWADTGIDEAAIPKTLQGILDSLANTASLAFPHNLLVFIEGNTETLLRGFLALFPALEAAEREHLGHFLLGDCNEQGALSWRILDRLHQLRAERTSLRQRIDALKIQIDQLERQPSDEARDLRLLACRDERAAMMAQIKRINSRLTLNFFTDEGLLPNYAFPEEGVTLKSVILRRKERKEKEVESDAGKTGKKSYEVQTLEFQRSAEAALGELAPENRFYAAAHHLNIEQVDLKLSQPETWRLCDRCHYTENIDETQSRHSACPRCGSPQWADISQQRTLLRLRQVYARADARYDRIADDADQREHAFYQRQLLVDIPEQLIATAWRLDSDTLPFGFEFLSSVLLREINFGSRTAEQEGFSVAGQVASRKGFKICSKCGMVKRERLSKGQFAHALDCPYGRPGSEEQQVEWLDSLYLYRELNSEAIRILLPLADVAYSEVARHSFIAGLNLALKTYFKGNVGHLRITEMLESGDVAGSSRQYLVLYDSIPGGSGYLKELMREPKNLLGMLAQARDHLSRCGCAEDEHRDGCYSCLLAYRDSRNMPKISRREALTLFSKIIEQADTLTPVEGLSSIQTRNSLLESPLEKRFLEALKQSFPLQKKTVNGKPGYWFKAGERHWELELQVELGPDQGVALHTRADFVIRPARESERTRQREWIIYTDGFAPHVGNLLDDTCKRQALIAARRQVLVLTWEDIPESGKPAPQPALQLLEGGRQSFGERLYDGLSAKTGLQPRPHLRRWMQQTSYQWLEQWLKSPDEHQETLQQSVLMTALSWMDKTAKEAVAACQDELQHYLPAVVREAMGKTPGLLGGRLDTLQSGAMPLGSCVFIPFAALSSLKLLKQQLAVHLYLDDTQVQEDKVFHGHWRAFWQAFNLLQFAPRFTLTCRSGIARQAYDRLLGQNEEASECDTPENLSSGSAQPDDGWSDVLEESFIEAAYLALLRAAQVPPPEVGLDLLDGDTTVGTAELCWPDLQLAVFESSADELPALTGWMLISTQDEGWVQVVLSYFKQEKS